MFLMPLYLFHNFLDNKIRARCRTYEDTRYKIQNGLRLTFWILSLSVILLLFAGCGEDKEKIRVGVSISGIAHPDFALIKQALDENADEYGARIVYNKEGLAKLLEDGIDVLILNNSDPRDLESDVMETHRKSIPVIILDCPPPQNLHVEAYITVNHFDAGKMAADYMARELGGEGKVIVLEGPGDDETSRQITLGIFSILEQYESIKVVADERHTGWNGELAANTVRSTLKKYAGNVQAVVAVSSQLAMGAVQAVREYRLTDKIITVGIGADLATCKAIIAGTHDAEVDMMPYGRGVEALNLAVTIAKGEDFEYHAEIGEEDPKIKVRYGPLRLITKKNVSVMKSVWPELGDAR
jgi:ABC-type sugar transport system substrate-binding protein